MQIKQTKIQSLVRYDAHLLYQYNVRVPQTVMCIKKGLSPIYLHLIFYILEFENFHFDELDFFKFELDFCRLATQAVKI